MNLWNRLESKQKTKHVAIRFHGYMQRTLRLISFIITEPVRQHDQDQLLRNK